MKEMRSRRSILILLTLTCTLMAKSSGQEAVRPNSSVQNQFALKVFRHPGAAPQMVEFHERLAQILNQARMGPPQERINYFRNLYVANSPDVIGWTGHIVKTEITPEGIAVTLEVRAKHEMFLDPAKLYETYFISGTTVRFGGSFAAPNTNRVIIGF